jgi:hypothetical protein
MLFLFLSFSFVRCIVCPSWIYGVELLFGHLQTFLCDFGGNILSYYA